jgi:hypothetical protein
MKITGINGQAVAQPLFSSSATQYHELGFGACFGGRIFRYAKAGATTLVAGNALQSAVEDTDHDAIACRVTAVGARSLLITTGSGSGALDENEYAEGFAVIDTTPGLGYTYSIKNHAAVAASTAGELFLVDGETVQVALTTGSNLTLVQNSFKNVIAHPPTTATNSCIGGAIFPIVGGATGTGEFGWIQTQGQGAALISGTPAAGQPVTSIGSVTGALVVHSAELNMVATMDVTGRDGKICPVTWLLD